MKIASTLWLTLGAIALSADLDLQKDERPVSPEGLTAIVRSANRVVVTDSPLQDKKILFESKERKDLDALSNALVVNKPGKRFHCMCIGTQALYLYKDDELLAHITNHHGQSVRCSLWSSDAPIADVENWLKWFDDRKIDAPRKEVEEMRKTSKQGEHYRKKWVAAIPKGLESVWEESLVPFGGGVNAEYLTKTLNVLKASIPMNKDQILVLLEWFGSGAGPWSGFPEYELVAEELLREYAIKEIVAVIEIKKLTPAQTEGAARLLAGWVFSRKKDPNALDRVPADTKQALWDYVKNTKDDDKIGMARYAFKPKEG